MISAETLDESEYPRRVEAFWRHDVVTPETDRPRRATDASRLTFSLQFVVLIVGAFLSTFGGIWAATWSLRSDVRDVLTRQTMQVEIDKTNAKLQEERAETLKEAISALTRQQQMQQYEIQNLKEMVLRQGVKR